MDATRLWRLEGVVRDYDWGSTTAIPELLGRPPTGEPQAELWLGAHPDAPARVVDDGGAPLDAWIRGDPVAVLGERVAEAFQGELPFLLKVLAAAEPLSIQAHPNREQARAGFDRENAAGLAADAPDRCYRDPRPKPELLCALTPFRALNRFRPADEALRRLSELGLAELGPVIAPLREPGGGAGLAAFFEGWMALPEDRQRALVERVAEVAATRPGEACAQVVALAERYPGDPGALAPFFLNLLELAPGEAMFLAAGELHAYLAGTGIELMASSDNVLRGGLTAKHVDVPELLSTLHFGSGPVVRLLPQRRGECEAAYATPAREFELSVLTLASGRRWQAPGTRSAEILLCTSGGLELIGVDGRRLALPQGSAAIAPAAAGRYAVEGSGVAYRAGVGLDCA